MRRVTQKAKSSVNGIEQQWDFDITKDLSNDYIFVIKLNGDTLFYDFFLKRAGESAKASMVAN